MKIPGAWMYSLVVVSLVRKFMVTSSTDRGKAGWRGGACAGRQSARAGCSPMLPKACQHKLPQGAVRSGEGHRGTDSTGGGGAGGQVRDRERTAERWGTQTNMLRPRG